VFALIAVLPRLAGGEEGLQVVICIVMEALKESPCYLPWQGLLSFAQFQLLIDSSCIPPLLTSHRVDRVVTPVDPRRLFPNDPRPFQLQSSDTHTRSYILKI